MCDALGVSGGRQWLMKASKMQLVEVVLHG